MKRSQKADPWKIVFQTIDKVYGSTIEDIVTKYKRPELRPKLKRMFLTKELFKRQVETATDKSIDKLEATLEEMASKLSHQIDAVLEKRKRSRDIAIAQHTKQAADFKLEFLELEPVDSEERQQCGIDMSGLPTDEEVINLLDSTAKILGDLEYHFFEFDKKSLMKDISTFRKKRRNRKIKRYIHRFMWSVIFVGVVASYFVSQGAKFFLESKLIWLLAVYVIWQAAKEYGINHLLKNNRLKLQKRHLRESYREFFAAYLSVLILAPSIEKRRTK